MRAFPPNDPTGSKRVQRYFDELVRRYTNWAEMMFPEIEPGLRVPAFHNRLPEEIVHFRLEEIAKRAVMVETGQIDPDEETERFINNVDGAQQKLLELRAKYNPPQVIDEEVSDGASGR